MQFTKDMKMPDPIPDEGISQAIKLMEKGKLYRYNFNFEINAETSESVLDDELASEVAKLENKFCQYMGYQYATAVNSCGSALFLSLKAAGIKAQEKVFTNAFTFTAVPSSIVHANGIPVYIECNKDYILDIDDFKNKVKANPDVRFLIVSHMRGHISDMKAIKDICDQSNIYLIEDCAHSLGAKWYDEEQQQSTFVGHHGQIACFSSQSYKLLNSGEGGLIATNDPKIAAYTILGAGSYEKLYKKHVARPLNDEIFESMKQNVPNFSLRMSNLAAAVLSPQIDTINERAEEYNLRYEQLVSLLSSVDNVYIPTPLEQVSRVGDSLQFHLKDLELDQVDEFVREAARRGVNIQIFGSMDNARYFKNWRYSFQQEPQLSRTDDIISFACDLRISLSFTHDDINLLGYIIKDVLFNVIKEKTDIDYRNGLADHFSSTHEVTSKYDSWVSEYNKEHYRNGWTVLLNQMVYALLSYLKSESKVLDMGCGTGLLGKELVSYGFQNLYGIDISKKSLESSQTLGIYKQLSYGELGTPLDFKDCSFDALVSSGVFTRNQVPLTAFKELIRILKPQGILAIVVRVEDDNFYENELKKYCDRNILRELGRHPFKVLSSCSHELVILCRSEVG